MDNSTIITYEKVQEDAKIIKECSNTMRNIFEDFNSIINQVGADDVFFGNASEALKTSFNNLKNRFESYSSTVDGFAKMISSAASTTEATEKAIASAAENLSK